jgi:hypothetical protein
MSGGVFVETGERMVVFDKIFVDPGGARRFRVLLGNLSFEIMFRTMFSPPAGCRLMVLHGLVGEDVGRPHLGGAGLWSWGPKVDDVGG